MAMAIQKKDREAQFMRKFLPFLITCILLLTSMGSAQTSSAGASQPPAAPDENAQLRQEVEQMKKAVAAMEERLAAQEKAAQEKKDEVKQQPATAQESTSELAATVKDLDHRVSQTERRGAMDRINFTGDYRFEAHSIWGSVPAHYDGMQLQNLVVKSMFFLNTNGGAFPTSIDAINNNVAQHYSDYQFFTNNLTFPQLKAAMGQFPAAMQQQLFGMLQPATLVPAYSNDTNILYTNRLRLNVDSKINDDLSVTARLSMYKAWGDSTGVQVFNGQASSMNIDGTTAGVPNSDMLRVERAYFTWNHVAGSPLYISIGRRPSTAGPPLNFREDEPRGGTPSGALIDFQFDGITIGYHFNDKMVWRLCYGVGYQSGFGPLQHRKDLPAGDVCACFQRHRRLQRPVSASCESSHRRCSQRPSRDALHALHELGRHQSVRAQSKPSGWRCGSLPERQLLRNPAERNYQSLWRAHVRPV
jgi:hypothetical protein